MFCLDASAIIITFHCNHQIPPIICNNFSRSDHVVQEGDRIGFLPDLLLSLGYGILPVVLDCLLSVKVLSGAVQLLPD